MTIELTTLPTIPADQVPAAFTMAAVPSPNGPVRYKAPLAAGGGGAGPAGPAGPGFTYRGAWAPNTAYAANDVVTNGGQTYVAAAAFTSGASFDSTNLTIWAAKGADGAPGAPGAPGTPGATGAPGAPGAAGAAAGPGSDTTAARLVDPRFRGIQRIDLKATYNARCDGTSHPLAGIFSSLAAATVAYPNAGLTAQNWSTMEIDTAAFLQAEYDIRTGSAGAGIIGLHEGASMMVSAQLNIQDASRVWFHGGRRTTLLTSGMGATPAIRLADCPNVGLPLADLQVYAQPTAVQVSSSGGGVAHTGFVTGSIFLELDNVQGIDLERVGWNGFDNPIEWGNHIYGIRFRQCGGSGCNIGFNWGQTVGLDSMERIYFEGGALANNNYGFYLDATYGTGKTSS